LTGIRILHVDDEPDIRELDANLLEPLRRAAGKETGPIDLARIRVIANGLAATADLFGLDDIRRTASMLEDAMIARLDGTGTQKDVSRALDCLLVDLESQWTTTPGRRA
jgi:CheY-like chemotaxis protein